MRVAPYQVALAIGDPRGLDFLAALRKTHAEGPVPPDLSTISRFCWQPRNLSGGFLEIFAMAEKEKIELAPRPLESEEGETSLPDWVSAESLITFHLQPKEFPPAGFYQPLLKGKEDAEIILIQSFNVLAIVAMIGGAITFFKKEDRAQISEFMESVLGRMRPPAVAPEPPVEEVPPAITFEEASGENDSSAAPQGEMEGVKNQEFDAISRVPLSEEEAAGRRTTGIFGTPPALKPPAPLSAESLASAEDDPTPPRREPSETAIVKHQPEPVMKAGRLDPLWFLLAEIRLAWLRRKMRRLAAEKKQEPPELLEKAGKLTKKMEELDKRLRIGERMQREREAGRFSFFISLLQRIRKW